MKEEKLFKIVNNIDDDLICEMLEYTSDRELQGEEYQGALYPVTEKPRKIHYWQYPVTAAALMLILVGVLFIVNLYNTLPYNGGEEQGNPADTSHEITFTSTEENTVSDPSYSPQSSPLDLLKYRLYEDGYYRVDKENVTAIDDYDLFRQYFFGAWEGSLKGDGIVIDDSMQSFNMNQHSIWYSDPFYKIGDNALAFIQGGSGGSLIYWLDMNAPETMYFAYGSVNNYGYITLWFEEESNAPVVSSLKKSNRAPNEPELTFLSIFKLHEMSRDYRIDFSLLVDMEYVYAQPDATYTLSHNAYALFYPVYLFSESADKLELKTTIGNGFDEDMEFNVSYTIEKIDGEWVRTVDTSGIYREITVIGDYDKSALVDFDCSLLLDQTTVYGEGAGDFIDEEYSEFIELYQKAYALSYCFTGRLSLTIQSTIITVPNVNSNSGYDTYYLSGYSYYSFYKAVSEVFTYELADSLISESSLFYIYEGAVWCCTNLGFGSDVSRVHDEYSFKLTEDTFDIILTTYHTTEELEWDMTFHPELTDQYEKQEHHFTFVNTVVGWQCKRFDTVW